MINARQRSRWAMIHRMLALMAGAGVLGCFTPRSPAPPQDLGPLVVPARWLAQAAVVYLLSLCWAHVEMVRWLEQAHVPPRAARRLLFAAQWVVLAGCAALWARGPESRTALATAPTLMPVLVTLGLLTAALLVWQSVQLRRAGIAQFEERRARIRGRDWLPWMVHMALAVVVCLAIAYLESIPLPRPRPAQIRDPAANRVVASVFVNAAHRAARRNDSEGTHR